MCNFALVIWLTARTIFAVLVKTEQFTLTCLTQLRMKTIYLIQLQTRNSKEQPSQPVAVPRENLIKFINENLREEVVMLISAVECYE